VTLPIWIRGTFEIVEAEFGLELSISLLHRPALMGGSEQLLHRCGGRQVREEILRARRAAEMLFAQEPHLWGPAGRASSAQVTLERHAGWSLRHCPPVQSATAPPTWQFAICPGCVRDEC